MDGDGGEAPPPHPEATFEWKGDSTVLVQMGGGNVRQLTPACDEPVHVLEERAIVGGFGGRKTGSRYPRYLSMMTSCVRGSFTRQEGGLVLVSVGAN